MGATIPTIFEVSEPYSIWAIKVSTPFDETYLEHMKEAVPARCRKWNGDEKVWLYKAPYVDVVVRLLQVHFGEYRWAKHWEQAAQARPRVELVVAYAHLHLLPSAPAPVVKAAYKALARLHHPDTGGSTEAMQRINAAVEQIEAAQVEAFAP